MNNYLEHETEVKFVDGLLAKSQDWQWFIDEIESNFDLEDILNYEDFQSRNNHLRIVLGNFIKLLEVFDNDLRFNKAVLSDIYNIARFYIGSRTVYESIKIITTNMGKILFVVVWLTKIENSDNATEYLTDMRFLSLSNLFQAINMQSFVTEEDNISNYLDTIEVDGFDIHKKCIMDNLKNVAYVISDDFFEVYGNNLLSANAFKYQTIQKKTFITWQEDTLLDMLAVSFKKKSIIPLYSTGNSSVPDYKRWTSELIGQLKVFFDNSIADFTLETIDYIQNGVIPEKVVVDTHCRMLKELIEKEEDFKIYSSSTYAVIASMFFDESINRIEKTGDVIELIKCIQKVESITLLMKFRDDGFPLSKDQQLSIKQYIVNQYKRIENIEDIYNLKEYLSNKDIAKHITQSYYNLVMKKFLKVVDNPRQQLIPTLFYQAMHFLLDVVETNQEVDKRIVKRDMIGMQEYWQTEIFGEQCKNLQMFQYSTSVESDIIDEFNKCALVNPISIAQKCLFAGTDDMVEALEAMSKNAIVYMVKKMNLSPVFPLDGAVINYDKHEIDVLLKKQIEEIKEKYGYKFLNVLDTDIYVSGIYERYRELAIFTIPMFRDERKVYSLIEETLNTKLIPYDDKIMLGHLTQLFPLLEMQIRKLGKMFGIVHFKERTSEFMKFKDPCSVLCELLKMVYNELGSFENASDLLFVYHFMYNGNSMNIRNECIHGRDYLEGGQLRYAFKVTLLALHMINCRIKVIEENMDKEEKI